MVITGLQRLPLLFQLTSNVLDVGDVEVAIEAAVLGPGAVGVLRPNAVNRPAVVVPGTGGLARAKARRPLNGEQDVIEIVIERALRSSL